MFLRESRKPLGYYKESNLIKKMISDNHQKCQAKVKKNVNLNMIRKWINLKTIQFLKFKKNKFNACLTIDEKYANYINFKFKINKKWMSGEALLEHLNIIQIIYFRGGKCSQLINFKIKVMKERGTSFYDSASVQKKTNSLFRLFRLSIKGAKYNMIQE
jgi:hypothetical protein